MPHTHTKINTKGLCGVHSLKSKRLGWVKDLVGQWIFDEANCLVQRGLAENLCEALQQLWVAYLKFFHDRGGSRYYVKVFVLATIGLGSSATDYPTLCSSIKGMRCKFIFIWICSRCIIAGNAASATQYEKERAQAAHHILSYIDLLDSADIFLNKAEINKAIVHGWSFLRWYQHFAFTAYEAGICAYKLRPKLHGFAHQLLEIADTGENPAKSALWGAEDLVGQVKKLGQKTHKRTIHNRMVRRRCLFVQLRAKRASWKPKLKRKIMN